MGHALNGLVLLAACSLPLPASADWAGFSGYSALAELQVQPQGISLDLRIPLDALPRLGALLGDPSATPDAIAHRLLRLQDGNGRLLHASHWHSGNETAPLPDGTSVAFLHTVGELPLDAPIDALMLQPPAGAGRSIGLMVLHRGVPLADLAPLGTPLSVRLDRNDPWQSRIEGAEFARRHSRPRSFLYVEPYEMRHEVLVRLSDLQRRLPLPLKNGSLEETDRPRVAGDIARLVRQRTRLQADGSILEAESAHAEFVAFTRSGVQPLTGSVDGKAALVGIMLVYLTEKPATSLSLTWDLFDTGAAEWPITVIDGLESFDAYVTPTRATLDWSRDDTFAPAPAPSEAEAPSSPPAAGASAETPVRKVTRLLALLLPVSAWFLWLLAPRHRHAGPALAASICAGALLGFYPSLQGVQERNAARLDPGTLRQNMPALLHNAYRAFALRGEEAAYDRLALSLEGELLDETYLQQRRAMLRQTSGLGGMGNVERIELQALESEPGGSPTMRRVSAEWIAHGSVSHWGHSHPRHNRYRARLTLRAGPDGHLRITAMDFLDGQTLGSGPSS